MLQPACARPKVTLTFGRGDERRSRLQTDRHGGLLNFQQVVAHFERMIFATARSVLQAEIFVAPEAFYHFLIFTRLW
jgi:hypothetical protein